MTAKLGFTPAGGAPPLQAHADQLAGGTCKLYNGTRPATAATAITTQTLLATVTLASPMGTVSGLTLTVSATAAAAVLATGTATWGRFATSAAVDVADGDVGLSSSAINVDDVNLIQNGSVSITGGSIQLPAS